MYLIIATVLGIIILIGVLIVIFGKKDNPEDGEIGQKTGGAAIAGIGLVILAIVTVISSATMVEARTVSIQTSFGKYDTTLSPGLNWTAPWAQFESFSTTLQPTDLNDFDDDKGDAVVVSFSAPRDPEKPDAKVLAGGGNGAVSAIVNWQISESQSASTGAKALWDKYKTFAAVSDQLVKAKAMEKIIEAAGAHPANEATVNQTGIGAKVRLSLSEALKPYGIVVQDVSIRRIVLDPATSASLQKIIDAINKTAAAQEEAKAAAIQNQILEDRAKAGALEQKANDRYCLDIVNSWNVAQNGPLPATFNCGLGASGTGVLVQSK